MHDEPMWYYLDSSKTQLNSGHVYWKTFWDLKLLLSIYKDELMNWKYTWPNE